MGHVQPVAITFLVNALEPDREPGLFRFTDSVLCDVAAIGDGDVAVHFDFYGVEISHVVLPILDALQERRAIIGQERLAAPRPAIAVRERKIRRAYTIT
jgi:hypothetical protein